MPPHLHLAIVAAHGFDNNVRMDFFGPGGDTRWNLAQLNMARFRAQYPQWQITRTLEAFFDELVEHELARKSAA